MSANNVAPGSVDRWIEFTSEFTTEGRRAAGDESYRGQSMAAWTASEAILPQDCRLGK
jgi:hypothetical protein